MRAHTSAPVRTALLLALAPVAAAAQQPPGPPPQPPPGDIIVNQDCVIREATPLGVKPRHYTDRGICNVSPTRFTFREETDLLLTGKRKRHDVQIREHTFTLHNPQSTPVTFVLEHIVPRGWQVDSDPPPKDLVGNLAVFYLAALPGQTISLHVGARKPPVSSPAPPLSPPASNP